MVRNLFSFRQKHSLIIQRHLLFPVYVTAASRRQVAFTHIVVFSPDMRIVMNVIDDYIYVNARWDSLPIHFNVLGCAATDEWDGGMYAYSFFDAACQIRQLLQVIPERHI